MRSRKIGSITFEVATIVMIGYIMFKMMVGKEIGFNDIIILAILLMTLLSARTGVIKMKKMVPIKRMGLNKKLLKKVQN